MTRNNGKMTKQIRIDEETKVILDEVSRLRGGVSHGHVVRLAVRHYMQEEYPMVYRLMTTGGYGGR